MAEQLKALGGLIDELLNAEGELSHLDEISTHIHEIHMSYQASTKDMIKARPVPIMDATPTMPRDHRSPYTPQYKLPQADMPTFEGDPKLWRRFWERFSQRISMFPGIPAADKMVQLERAIKPPDRRALILAAKGTEEEYVASVKALQKRYDQPRRIYRAYVQDAFGHLTPRTRKGIYELITHAQESMTALRLYGGMDAGSVMVAIYEKGLDKETTKEWSAYTSRKKLKPTMEHFKEFLTQQAEELVEEELPYMRTTPTAPKP